MKKAYLGVGGKFVIERERNFRNLQEFVKNEIRNELHYK